MQHQILKLTGVVIPGVNPGIFVGWIKEIDGITVQGSTAEDTLSRLKAATKVMLGYKDKEARQLLAKQLGTSIEEINDVILDPEVALS